MEATTDFNKESSDSIKFISILHSPFIVIESKIFINLCKYSRIMISKASFHFLHMTLHFE